MCITFIILSSESSASGHVGRKGLNFGRTEWLAHHTVYTVARMAMSLSWGVDVPIVQQDIVLLRNYGMDTESRTCFVVSAEHCNTTWSVTSVAAAYTQRI